MIHKRVVASLFLVMFGAETTESMQSGGADSTQLEIGQSKTIICTSWNQIRDEVFKHISYHENKRILVGIDVDDTLIKNDRMIDGKVIPEFLGVLSEKKIAYFCLTATLSCIWPEKREDLDIAGLDKLFCRNSVANTPFSRIWKRDLDDSKKYYWDFEYSTMYSVRANPAESKVSEENPLARVNLYQVRDWIKTSKGKVFQSAVEDEIITKPDVMVFIDDRIDNVKDVRLACEQLRINYLGIVCNF